MTMETPSFGHKKWETGGQSSVRIEAGSHVERLSLDLLWTKALLERNNDRSESNTMKQEISGATCLAHDTYISSCIYTIAIM